jgi:hypothetical protein
VRKQMQRNHQAFSTPIEEMPVYGTVAAHFNDDGVTALYQGLLARMHDRGLWQRKGRLPAVGVKASTGETVIVPPARQRYLAEIAETVRDYKRTVDDQVRLARERQQLLESQRMLVDSGKDASMLDELISKREQALDPRARKLIEIWPSIKQSYAGEEYVVKIRDKEIRTPLTHTTLSGTRVPKVVLPRYEDHGELLRWLLLENSAGCCLKTYPGRSRTRPVFSPSSGKKRTQPACLPARAIPSGPTAASSTSRKTMRPSVFRPPSIRSRSTATILTSARTSTAKSAIRVCLSPLSMT